MKVLIVDKDSNRTRKWIREGRRGGCQVAAIDRGRAAVELGTAFGADAIVLDADLADMNTCEVLAALRRDLGNVPVYVTAEHADAAVRKTYLGLGAREVGQHPIEPEAVLHRFRHWTGFSTI